MANLQVKNVPEDVHQQLKRRAKRLGRTVRDLVLEAVRREADREKFLRRLHRRESVELDGGAWSRLEEARAAAGKELDR